MFEYPTLLDYFKRTKVKEMPADDCISKSLRCFVTMFDKKEKKPSAHFRALMLSSSPIRRLYQRVIQILIDMWSLGVIHGDRKQSEIYLEFNFGEFM